MANILTITRIIGMFPLFILISKNGINTANFILFVILSLTDMLDGFIARKFNQITTFGKIADGIADKLFVLGITIAFLIKKLIPYWSLIIFLREITALIYATIYIKKKKMILESNIFGKAKTTFHMTSLGFIFLFGKWNYISEVLIIIAILLFIPEFIHIYRKKLLKSN